DVEVIRELALGSFKSYFLPDAEKYLNQWCRLEPAGAEPHLQRLRLRKRLGRLDEALADGEKLVEVAPADLDVHKEVIILMIQARHYADAGQNCRRLLQQHPDDTRLRYFLAECCHSEGRDEEAGALLDAVLKEDPNYTDALILRAVLSCDAGQDGEAVPLLRRVKDREPLRSVPRYYLSLALARTGHVAEAENEMAEAQQLLKAERVIEDAQI